jgi:membrane peptidoglycan carboxypeptidase
MSALFASAARREVRNAIVMVVGLTSQTPVEWPAAGVVNGVARPRAAGEVSAGPVLIVMKCRRVALGAAIVLFGVAGVAVTWSRIDRSLPSIEPLSNYEPPAVTVLLDRSGELIGELYDGRRYVLPIEQILHHVQDAFIAAEDASFRTHWGRAVPWPRATLRITEGLEAAAAPAPPDAGAVPA